MTHRCKLLRVRILAKRRQLALEESAGQEHFHCVALDDHCLGEQCRSSRRGNGRARASEFIAMILGACTWNTAAIAMSDEVGTLDERPLVVYLADQLIYSDNLFRLSDSQPIPDEFLAQGAEREDYANRISAGLRAKIDNSRQSFALDLRGSDVLFRHADYLDHTAGHADLQWRWQFGNAWSGKITGEYDHALASLANYRYFGRDIVDTYAYSGELEYRIGARWALSAGGRAARTTHSAEDRRLNDFESEAATLTLAYITPSENRLALEYRYTAAKFPREALATSLTSFQYDESIAR